MLSLDRVEWGKTPIFSRIAVQGRPRRQKLATEMTELFAATGRGGKEDKAARGARAMVDSIDLVLDALGYAGDR